MTDCRVCGSSDTKRPAIFRNEDWCSDIHRKIITGEITSTQHSYFIAERDTHTMFSTKQYVRKPFYVEAVRVDLENMHEVATWCRGVVTETVVDGDSESETYIDVPVVRPLSDRQKQARPGDWILRSGSNFKVYTHGAFTNSFNEVVTSSVTAPVTALV